jgi:hypothetical protein
MRSLRRRPSGRERRRAFVTGAVSVALHVALVAALLSVRPQPQFIEPPVMAVSLVAPAPAPPPPKPPAPLPPAPDPAPAKAAAPPTPKPKPAPSRRQLARRAPASPSVAPVPTGHGASDEGDAVAPPSAGQVAGAATAGEGAGGGACNMLRRLQQALRRDARVQAAVADAERGQPIYLWNGAWVRHGGQDGAGLAAVREAILWEVGFAPAECRTEAVHGLVLISLADHPGAPRLVLGEGDWRWSDLLGRRAARGSEP